MYPSEQKKNNFQVLEISDVLLCSSVTKYLADRAY